MPSLSRLTLKPTPPFNFRFTAYSHGWVLLAPNSWDEERRALGRIERLPSGQIVRLDVSARDDPDHPRILIRVESSAKLSSQDKRAVKDAVHHMFRLDEDFSEFYALCRARGGRWKNLTRGLGRLLRSPTVFEDVVKTICTTNIQWSGTTRLVQNLVDTFGQPYPSDIEQRAFPTPETLASASLQDFTETVRLGYRGAYVHELAQQVASGELDLESLHDPAVPTPEIHKRLLAIKGIGPYAAATLLMLLGRYDELGFDTVMRDFIKEKYLDGRTPTEKDVQAIYADWGRWKYLAYWFDIWQEYTDFASELGLKA